MDDWITTREAVKVSGYHAEHIRKLVRDRKIKAQKFGEVWQVSQASLLEYVKKQTHRGEKRGPKK